MCNNKIIDTLVVIPARGGSKGLPGKNIKLLHGKPLIHYTIEAARSVFPDEHICVSTDDVEIIKSVEQTGLRVPFIRPVELSTDFAGSWDVVRHAYHHYQINNFSFMNVVLLQPTSPLRNSMHICDAYKVLKTRNEVEMVISVMRSKYNPYFHIFEEDKDGWLSKSKVGGFVRRQDCPEIYVVNGALYYIKASILDKYDSPFDSSHISKYIMGENESVDIDTAADFEFAETILSNKNFIRRKCNI